MTDAELIEMWNGKNMTIPQIAAKSGQSKNKVNAHVTRLRKSGIELDARFAFGKFRKQKTRVAPTAMTVAARANNALHPNQCRYPIGHPENPDFHFCFEKKTHGSYCAEHHHIICRRDQ